MFLVFPKRSPVRMSSIFFDVFLLSLIRTLDVASYTGSEKRIYRNAQMAKKTIYLASTDTPFTPYRGTDEGQKQAVKQLRSAWENDFVSTATSRWLTIEW